MSSLYKELTLIWKYLHDYLTIQFFVPTETNESVTSIMYNDIYDDVTDFGFCGFNKNTKI